MNKILVLVDCQNDFITGSLANKEAQIAVPRIVEKINNFDGDLIIATQDTHWNGYLNTPEGQKLPVEHCIDGTKGWEIEPEINRALLDAADRNIRITHISKNTFGSKTLMETLLTECGYIDNVEPHRIEFAGFCTDICVVSNALLAKAAVYNTSEIFIDSSCCAGVTPELHEKALDVMRSCQINVY